MWSRCTVGGDSTGGVCAQRTGCCMIAFEGSTSIFTSIQNLHRGPRRQCLLSPLDWIGRPCLSPNVRECQQQRGPWLLCPLVAQGRICGMMALLLLTSFVGDVEGQSVTRPEAAPPTRGKSIRVMGVQPDWLPIVQSAARYTAMLCSKSLARVLH